MRTSLQQAEFLRKLAPNPSTRGCKPLVERVRTALGDGIDPRWHEALTDLLTILGDHEVAEAGKPMPRSGPATLRIATVTAEQDEAMRRNWWSSCPDEIRNRVVHLRVLYDWPALVATIDICPTRSLEGAREPASDNDAFQIQDLFNVLDVHHQSGHGFPVREGAFLTPQRLLGARNALGLLLQVVQYVDWHSRARVHPSLRHHYDFGVALGRRMQRQGRHIATALGSNSLDDPSFVAGPVSIVSLNWDAIGLWVQFLANRDPLKGILRREYSSYCRFFVRFAL